MPVNLLENSGSVLNCRFPIARLLPGILWFWIHVQMPLEVGPPLLAAVESSRKQLRDGLIAINPIEKRKRSFDGEIERPPFVVVNSLLCRCVYGDFNCHWYRRRQEGPLTNGVRIGAASFRDADETGAKRYWKATLIREIYRDLKVVSLKGVRLQSLYSPIGKVNALVELCGHQISLAFHESSLHLHGGSLAINKPNGTVSENSANYADRYKQQIKEPRTPVENVVPGRFVLVRYGHHRTAGEFYAVLGILGCYAIAFLAGVVGLERWESSRWLGGALIALALLSCPVGTITGGSRLLAWYRWGYLHRNADEKSHQQHLPHGETVSQRL